MASSARVNLEGAMLLEQAFAKVPYESYKKVFRTSQRYIERDINAIQSASNELCSQQDLKVSTAIDALEGMISKAEGLKLKLSELNEKSAVPMLDLTRERLQHLSTLESFRSKEDPSYQKWSDTRLNRWLVDWSLRNGKMELAKHLSQEKDLERYVDIDLFTEIDEIESALQRHSCIEALAWCNENKTALRKAKSTLEFDLRLQEYIELARARKVQEALAYCRKHLLIWHETHLREIRRACGLLAYPCTTKCAPYKRLYDSKRWDTLAKSFRLAAYQLNSITAEPLFHIALFAGLTALKLRACYDDASKNTDCLVCEAEGFGELANEVPWSHQFNSTIVCYISGKIMNEDNPPMAFPNGYVYSKEVLEEMASKSKDHTITCPRSGYTCTYNELRKVFIS